MEKIYAQIAKAHGVTAEAVKKDMAEAPTCAWESQEKTAAAALLQSQIAPDGQAPSAEVFIRHIADAVKK